MKSTLAACLLMMVFGARAELVYCTGEVAAIITRNSSEGVQVSVETSQGTSSAAQIGDHTGLNDLQNVQVSMLLSAQMIGKEVTLELNTNGFTFESCTNFDRGLPIRFVRLKN